ncbi:TPA: hypothetical protein RMT45_001011 [Escherichia coli]|uniref:hypothetical protein n=1 Tax=Escherichia coli TaxID=562 RepID=UPI0019C23484|nr:hypothetical protein [Escherichia coli]EHM3079735.1 hypothetical protein [Escherichia coli]EKK2001734.1 hypothetical protein [Escherichia coli]EMB7671113.1 hypothetical protein [Escherichia coli]MCV0709521.1 hypothetical protein [Escherichia coli]
MSEFERISIPSGTRLGAAPISSSEDEPPSSEVSTRGDNVTPQSVEDAKSYRKLREVFAEKAYKVAKKSLYGWAILLFAQGWFSLIGIQIFSDKVLIAITTAVTLNVFAAFLGVIRGLFPSGKSSGEKE